VKNHSGIFCKLPACFSVPLFGDRERWGFVPVENDPCWREWTDQVYSAFYYANQKGGVGNYINNAGYGILKGGDLSGMRVLEIGPGEIRHLPQWFPNSFSERQGQGRAIPYPQYVIADIRQDMLDRSVAVLKNAGLPCETQLLQRSQTALPFADGEFDRIITFYALEHVYPLGPYLDEMKRILKPGGKLIGAIPAEGGLAWGLGRFLTSRRWLKKNTNIDPDKLICWEHPNFANYILSELSERFDQVCRQYWPFRFPCVDLNLIVNFIYRKAN
jgi:SAM-dependent methyltransferase